MISANLLLQARGAIPSSPAELISTSGLMTQSVLAFLALLTAVPGPASLAIFLFNAALFAHAAASDERALAASPLAEAYAAYKRRTGMFVPRWRRSRG